MIKRYKMFSNMNPAAPTDFTNFTRFLFLADREQHILWTIEITVADSAVDTEYTEEQLRPTTVNADGTWNTSIPGAIWRHFDYRAN